MTFLAPLFLVAGVAGAVLVATLHLIARQRPRTTPLPTARFVPERQVRAPSRSVWPTDLALLALRLTMMVLVAAAFARPVWQERRAGTARVVLRDYSRAVASIVEVSDSARRFVRTGDASIAFDSATTSVPGSLSAALIAGIRAARTLARTADSVELVIISPFATEEWDSATDRIRALWPGRIRLVPVSPAAPRARPSVVDWPSSGGVLDSSGAVSAGDITVVAPFGRAAIAVDSGSRVIARWANGAPAAVERDTDTACVRVVGIRPPTSGDLELRASYRRLVSRLNGPCGVEERFARADSTRLAMLAGDRPILAAAGFAAPPPADSRLAATMLGLALLLALAELFMRRRGLLP